MDSTYVIPLLAKYYLLFDKAVIISGTWSANILMNLLKKVNYYSVPTYLNYHQFGIQQQPQSMHQNR